MKQKKQMTASEMTASEMGKKGYQTRLAKLGKKGFSQAMKDAVNKRYNRVIHREDKSIA